jgi:ubiquinone/menaquinone biosynthesis C-methylase UbiE
MRNLPDPSNIYASGEYIRNNPTLDVEDTPWKLEKILPALDNFIKDSIMKDIKLLDVGGGAGLILDGVSDYLRDENINVKKYALDLSKEMLQIQKENNPDMITLLEGGIEKTSFRDKEIDLVLMVDVLEHVSDPVAALKELNRISKYVIFKVPLEDNIYYNMLNFFKRGGLRRYIINKVGHINSYNFAKLRDEIIYYTGQILSYRFTDVFAFYLSEDYHRQLLARERILYSFGKLTFFLSPQLSSCLFPDSVVVLVKCR